MPHASNRTCCGTIWLGTGGRLLAMVHDTRSAMRGQVHASRIADGEMAMTKVVGIVGYRDSGKTTLARELVARGFQVAVVRHTSH